MARARPVRRVHPAADRRPAYIAGFNANGIVASRGWLILVQSNTGQLFRVDPRTGATQRDRPRRRERQLRRRHRDRRLATLYVVRNQLNEIAVFRLAADLRSARVVGTLTSPRPRRPDDRRVPGRPPVGGQRPVLDAGDARPRRTGSRACRRGRRATHPLARVDAGQPGGVAARRRRGRLSWPGRARLCGPAIGDRCSRSGDSPSTTGG